jgi:hypothetical protein
MAFQTQNQSEPPTNAGGVALRIAAALIHTVPLGLGAGLFVAFSSGGALGHSLLVGGLIGLAFGVIVGTADWLGLRELLRRSPQAPGAEPVAIAESGAEPDRRPAGDLWLLMIGPPVFAGLILCIPLMATSTNGGPWGNIAVVLVVAAVFVIWATVVSPRCLQELARRGEWVPRGTDTHPYRVGLVLTTLLMATVVAVSHVAVWLLQLCGV